MSIIDHTRDSVEDEIADKQPAEVTPRGSQSLPCFPIDACLPQYPVEQLNPNIALMGVGNDDRHAAVIHLGMFPPWIWAGESQLAQTVNEIPARDRTERRHQTPAGACVRSIPSTTGTGRCLSRRNVSQLSNASASSLRHASNEGAFAHTPWKPGISP